MGSQSAIIERLERLERLLMLNASNVLDVGGAATFLGVTARHIYRLTRERKVPYYKQNGHLYFRRDELEAWMTATRIGTTAEIEAEAEAYIASRDGLA